MTTAEFRAHRDAQIDKDERSACIFVASVGALVTVVWAGLLVRWLS